MDNKRVIKGVGKFIDCIGLPLIFVLDEFKKENLVVDWIDFIDYCIEKNWDIKQTITKIDESLTEIKEQNKEIILKNIKLYLVYKFKNSS